MTLTESKTKTITAQTEPLACRHCGHVNHPLDRVVISHTYIGGQGYCWLPYCVDRTACHARHDREVRERLIKGVVNASL